MEGFLEDALLSPVQLEQRSVLLVLAVSSASLPPLVEGLVDSEFIRLLHNCKPDRSENDKTIEFYSYSCPAFTYGVRF
jgi:hypothetical protein